MTAQKKGKGISSPPFLIGFCLAFLVRLPGDFHLFRLAAGPLERVERCRLANGQIVDCLLLPQVQQVCVIPSDCSDAVNGELLHTGKKLTDKRAASIVFVGVTH